MKSGLKKLVGWTFMASETAKECKWFYVYNTFEQYFLRVSEAVLKTFFHESQSISYKLFVINLNFYYGF